MELNNYELKKLSKLLRDYLGVTFSSTVATKIPYRIFAMELLQKMGKEGINEVQSVRNGKENGGKGV